MSVLDGCVLWNAQVVVRPPGRERIIQELCEIHVHQGIARMKSLARSRVWWASLDANLEAKCGLPNLMCAKCKRRVESLENHTWGRKSLKGLRNRLLKIRTFITPLYYPDKFTISSPNSDVT